MENSIADRILWAVQTLAVGPSDLLLEIGCGNGSAVSFICRHLIDGKITGIDRSESMIHAAKKVNAGFISEGKASFIAAPFDTADLSGNRFNKIFAINVNLFWMKAAHELEIIRERLLPEGAVYLFNQPPAAEKIRYIMERTAQNLQDAGFNVRPVIIGDQQPVPVVCVIGTLNSDAILGSG